MISSSGKALGVQAGDVDVHVGQVVRRMRELRGLSKAFVGREIGTTYQQVRKYESGQNRIERRGGYPLASYLIIQRSSKLLARTTSRRSKTIASASWTKTPRPLGRLYHSCTMAGTRSLFSKTTGFMKGYGFWVTK